MLDKLKRRLGIKDTIQDELLEDFLNDAEAHFRLITGAHSVHSRYEFIIITVAAKLYNRKGSEGMSQEVWTDIARITWQVYLMSLCRC